MACSITIDGVFGLGAGPSVIRVIGTVVDCPADVEGNAVIVGISCISADGPFIERPAETDLSGNWQVLIPVQPNDNCRCNQSVFVRAHCATQADCSAEFTEDQLKCVECPAIRFTDPDDVARPPSVVVECNPDGTATVTVSYVVDNTTTMFIHVRVQPGHPAGIVISGGLNGIAPGSSVFLTTVLQYPAPSAPAPFFEILDMSFNPTGCPPVPIPLGPIGPCEPSECPVITGIDVELGQCETDTADGVSKRRVLFTPTVVGPDPAVAHNWSFGDGISVLVSGPPVPIPHLYAATPISEPELCVTGPGECATSCYSVPLSEFDAFQPCECPDIVSVAVDIGECERDPADGKLKRRVTFTPVITGPPPSAHTWSFGDGGTDFASGPPGPTEEHLYESKPTTEPELCITGPDPGCEDQCHQVPLSEFDAFEPCEEGPPPPDERPPPICGALTFLIAGLIALAFGLTLVAITLQVCFLGITVPGWLWGIIIGIWIAVALAVAIAYILCFRGICPCPNRCDWLAIAWIVALAGAIVALYLSGCCTLMLVISVVNSVIYAVSFGLWLRECEPGTCLTLDYLSIAIVTGAGTILGFLIVLPVIKTCGLQWVAVVVSTLAGLIVIATAACHQSSE